MSENQSFKMTCKSFRTICSASRWPRCRKGAPMDPNAVHVEVDMRATKDEKHGFKKDEWISYLTISYTIEKAGTKFKKTGKLMAMTADDGPHYANNVSLMGDGDYRFTYRFEPPSKAGFIRHVDKESGVPDR